MAKVKTKSIQIINKILKRNYQVLSSYIAGLVLEGSEVKSLRQGQANLVDSYAQIKGGEVWLLKLHISPYEHSGFYGHESERARKLLLKKSEIKKLAKEITQPGLTLVPAKFFTTDKGLFKVELCLVQGKKDYDRRQDLKAKSWQRDKERLLKNK